MKYRSRVLRDTLEIDRGATIFRFLRRNIVQHRSTSLSYIFAVREQHFAVSDSILQIGSICSTTAFFAVATAKIRIQKKMQYRLQSKWYNTAYFLKICIRIKLCSTKNLQYRLQAV